MDLSERYGFITILAHVVNIIPYIVAQAFIVEKANKCLDYTVTTWFMHTIGIWRYSGRFPWTFNYFLVHGLLITVTTLAAEFVLMRIEQQEIKLEFDVNSMSTMVEQGRAVINEVQDKVARI